MKDTCGESVSYDTAYNEVVANAMSKMFDDGKLVEKLAKLKEQDKDLAQKLWEGFKKILSKFIGIYQKESALFKDAADLMEMKETFERLQNMFAEALVEASENYQTTNDESYGEQYSSQETDVDTGADFVYDGAKEEPVYALHQPGQDVQKFDHSLWMQKRAEAKQAYGLDDVESDGVDNYVAGKAYEWNAILREIPGYERTEFIDFWIEHTINGLSKFPRFAGRTYRNLSFADKDSLDLFLSKHQAGMDVNVEYFASSSKDPNGYVVSGDYIAHMVIDGFDGRNISDSYAIPGQQEVIYLPGTKLRITSVKIANDGHPLIYAQEVKGNGKDVETNYGGNGQSTAGTNNERQEGNAGGKGNDIRRVRNNRRMEGNSVSRNAKIQRSGDLVKELLSSHETDADDDLRNSEHDTDYSNRDLLANALESVTQSSIEYQMIQEYKGRIRLINEYEEKLAKLNAEIRQIRFGTKGKRDTERLKQLETEARTVAANINRNDRKLLSLEASEPLRKVIVQERKKEAQRVKKHVKEIQENKKLRTEHALPVSLEKVGTLCYYKRANLLCKGERYEEHSEQSRIYLRHGWCHLSRKQDPGGCNGIC